MVSFIINTEAYESEALKSIKPLFILKLKHSVAFTLKLS